MAQRSKNLKRLHRVKFAYEQGWITEREAYALLTFHAGP